ncbi:rhodanese-related sulfurtransferase [Alterisphingorhabdus coralli]|uniref:tRNA uridine(34) hydroxylase n=1 Tax=Alterisphingorhabdus coralli TaxID=3071408 RepID=A0AA97F7J2_9SPHN|nr:rhodanese-related sulfurtransferase [Parasphingorhabdus sp. SCSIO 66989]WOE75854.1 rhodanese-related sulfurtransferase [Parasphingorhabdus sp. SCSIO 66989]
MSKTPAPYCVAALYHFAPVADREAMQQALQTVCVEQGVKGTVLIADEGVNGTIAGDDEAVETVIAHIREYPGFEGLEVKYSYAEEAPFLRMKVRLKSEIVTMGVDGVDAAHDKGEYIAPTEWNAAIADPDTIVIDTRNTYEVAIGSFDGAINPDTHSFRDFPQWFDDFAQKLREQDNAPRIAMFCTGGIRCEKATAYVRQQGFDDVVHLKGGILKYLENVPEAESQFDGSCFVFDERVSVTHGLKQGEHTLCRACRRPLTPDELKHPDYVEGEQCQYCAHSRTEEQKARYRERQKQMELAERRNAQHLAQEMEQKQKNEPVDDLWEVLGSGEE